jgi:CRISPR-associated protein Cas5d
MNDRRVKLRIEGEFACFTRPENKIERVSYAVMTPSAARGVLEAIYWHPQFTWKVREIQVLAEVKTFSILRNEVNSKASPQASFLMADEDRTQRHSVCLRNVEYLVIAEPVVKQNTEPARKHIEIFERRVDKGQCYHRPCLGTREFAAEFSPADCDAKPPIDWTEDLGLMLWDLDFPERDPKRPWKRGVNERAIRPLFFHAKVDKGILRVPSEPMGGNP